MLELIALGAVGMMCAATGSTATRPKTQREPQVAPEPQRVNGGGIRLLVRGDDIGSSHAANVATIRCFREGIMRSAEIMVPCPWFPEAVTLLKENLTLDIGVHITLTSEWDGMKWRPLTHAPSIVDENGYFHGRTGPREGDPASDFCSCGFKLDEVEREMRAQIEMAMKYIKRVTHISSHMGTSGCTPELRELSARLAEEYSLGWDDARHLRRFRGFEGASRPAERLDAMVRNLEGLEPGDYLFVDHPGLDTPEMRALGHAGYWDVAEERAAVTTAFTSPRVWDVIKGRKIQLISYGDLRPKR
jgi:chitin disaccharide deacetylase